MEAINASDTVFWVDRCKCCLYEDDLKNLWGPYDYEGETEIYGEMLSECFALPWQQPEPNTNYVEMICTACIKRLREAFSFKREVLVSEEVLQEHQEKLYLSTIVKIEQESDQEKDVEFQDVEYLDFNNEDIRVIQNDRLQISIENTTSNEKKKWPKKLPKEYRNKTYKQYTARELRMAIEAVQNNTLTRKEASELYKVPRKTLNAKLQTSIANKEEADEEASRLLEQEKHYKLVEEIKTILTYTNAIPYKTKTSRYYCAYCSTDGPHFEDPDDLRTHTRTKHLDERTKSIDNIMRPQWLNEVLKLDIHSLHCTICCIILPQWNDMFRHLETDHNIVLDEAYSKVIPFILQSELFCALCSDPFPNYNSLDGHMNAHYSNYICYECGDTFLAASRLKKHVEVHNIGKHPCDACGKVFKLRKYMRKHYDLVHGMEQKNKCLYCPERFFGTFQRHQHVLQCHPERVKVVACEICGKTFDWKPYHTAHMRKIHGSERNYKCRFCDKTFLMKYELKNHQIRHVKEKNFKCEVCSARFKTNAGLLRHTRLHHNSNLGERTNNNSV